MNNPDRFLTTDWSLVRKAHDSDALERLMARYWKPIYAYICAKGHTPDEAADLTQSFVTVVLLGRGLFEKADPTQGSFRAYLVSSLRNHLIDTGRRTNREKDTFNPVDLSTLPHVEPGRDPHDAFQLEWARQILSDALERTHLSCIQEDQAIHWQAFELKVLGPIRSGTQPSNAQIAAETGIDQGDVSQRVQTVKRKLQAAIKDVLNESVSDAGQLEDEYRLVLERLGATVSVNTTTPRGEPRSRGITPPES